MDLSAPVAMRFIAASTFFFVFFLLLLYAFSIVLTDF